MTLIRTQTGVLKIAQVIGWVGQECSRIRTKRFQFLEDHCGKWRIFNLKGVALEMGWCPRGGGILPNFATDFGLFLQQPLHLTKSQLFMVSLNSQTSKQPVLPGPGQWSSVTEWLGRAAPGTSGWEDRVVGHGWVEGFVFPWQRGRTWLVETCHVNKITALTISQHMIIGVSDTADANHNEITTKPQQNHN